MTNYLRAKKVVGQINNGDWTADYSERNDAVYTIKNNGVEIWVCSGGFNCKIHRPDEVDAFGLFWRHWVWFSAQKIRRKALADGRSIIKKEALINAFKKL